MAVLEQHLALQLVKIGIVRILGDQRIDALERRGQVGQPVKGDGSGIPAEQRVVRLVALQDLARIEQERLQFDDHAAMREFPGGRRFGETPALRRDLVLDEPNAVPRQGMALQIRAHPRHRQNVLAVEDVEELRKARRRDARALEIADAGLVGGLLLAAAEAHEIVLRIGLAAGDDRRAEGGCGDHGGRAEHGGQDHLGGRALLRPADPAKMPARDVAGFMRHHPGQLPGILGAHDQPGVEEQVHAARDERVQLIVVDDVDAHRIAPEPRGVQERPRHLLQGRFDLGVADQADARRARRPIGQQRQRRAEHERRSPARSVCHVH